MEENTPVSEGEIAKENSFMLKRRDAFRHVAEMTAVGFSKLPFVQKVVLFGSVAVPPVKEVPRFRRLRRARAEIFEISARVFAERPSVVLYERPAGVR